MDENSKQNRKHSDFTRQLIQIIIVFQREWFKMATELLVSKDTKDYRECSNSQFRDVEVPNSYLNDPRIHFDEFPVEMLRLIFAVEIAIF